MKTFCRLLACLLAFVMLAAIFAACGSTTTTPTAPASDTSTSQGEKSETPTAQPTETPTAQPTATPTAQPTATPTEAPTETPTATPTDEPTPTVPDTPTPTPTPTPTSNLPSILKSENEAVERFDTNGEPMEIVFYVNGGDYESLSTRSISVDPDDEGNQPDLTYGPNKATQERNDTIKNLIGTKIKIGKVGSMQGTSGEVKPIFQSQEHVYDIMVLYQYFDLGLALGDTVGSFYNLENMPEDYTNYLNIQADYWNTQLYDIAKLRDPDSGNSVCFFLTGDATQTNVGNMFVSYVNQRMWEDYADRIKDLETSGGYSNIYDIVNNGYWTMDLWADISNLCWQDLNANDKPDREDQVGVLLYGSEAGVNNMSVEWLTYGGKVCYTALDESGKPVADANSKHNMEVFRAIYKLYCECKTATMPYIYIEGDEEATDAEYIMSYFARGNVMMTVNELKTAEEFLTEMTDDYYVMPLPMINHAQYNKNIDSLGYCSGLGDSLSQFAIVVYGGDERIPALTATLELMSYLGNKLVIPEYYDIALKGRFLRDPLNAAMVDTIHDGIYSNFGLIWSNRLNDVTWNIRTCYNNLNGMADTWKDINKSLKGSIKKLYNQIQTAWFVQY